MSSMKEAIENLGFDGSHLREDVFKCLRCDSKNIYSSLWNFHSVTKTMTCRKCGETEDEILGISVNGVKCMRYKFSGDDYSFRKERERVIHSVFKTDKNSDLNIDLTHHTPISHQYK